MKGKFALWSVQCVAKSEQPQLLSSFSSVPAWSPSRRRPAERLPQGKRGLRVRLTRKALAAPVRRTTRIRPQMRLEWKTGREPKWAMIHQHIIQPEKRIDPFCRSWRRWRPIRACPSIQGAAHPKSGICANVHTVAGRRGVAPWGTCAVQPLLIGLQLTSQTRHGPSRSRKGRCRSTLIPNRSRDPRWRSRTTYPFRISCCGVRCLRRRSPSLYSAITRPPLCSESFFSAPFARTKARSKWKSRNQKPVPILASLPRVVAAGAAGVPQTMAAPEKDLDRATGERSRRRQTSGVYFCPCSSV
jgi:hypothetical protein